MRQPRPRRGTAQTHNAIFARRRIKGAAEECVARHERRGVVGHADLLPHVRPLVDGARAESAGRRVSDVGVDARGNRARRSCGFEQHDDKRVQDLQRSRGCGERRTQRNPCLASALPIAGVFAIAQELVERTGRNPQYEYIQLGCSERAVQRMLRYAKSCVGRPFSQMGMARSILWPRQTDSKSFFCAGASVARKTPAASAPKRAVVVAQSSSRPC